MSGKEKIGISFNKSKILISNSHPSIKAPLSHRYIKSAINRVLDSEKASLQMLSLNYVNKKSIKAINKRFLGHNYFTDIITFSYGKGKIDIEGEIFMCLDEIKENAEFYDISFKNEFERVVIHGCLHLTGYKDKTKTQKELIRNKENFYLSE